MNADEPLTVSVLADTRGFDRALGDLADRADSFGTAMSRALTGAVAGGKSLEDVLAGLGRRISSIALDAALDPLEGLVSDALGGLAGGLFGSAAGAGVTPFAKGGVVRAPSYFPTGGGLGLMGEAGPEAIMPLKRGADGGLGVAAPAPASAPSITLNVQTPDADSFRRSEPQIRTMLARAAMRGRRGL